MLDTYYERGNDRFTRTLVLQGAREADLVPIMEEFIEAHPAVIFSSLPKFVEGGTEVHLSLSGTLQDVENGIRDLIEKLEAMGLKWEEKMQGASN